MLPLVNALESPTRPGMSDDRSPLVVDSALRAANTVDATSTRRRELLQDHPARPVIRARRADAERTIVVKGVRERRVRQHPNAMRACDERAAHPSEAEIPSELRLLGVTTNTVDAECTGSNDSAVHL